MTFDRHVWFFDRQLYFRFAFSTELWYKVIKKDYDLKFVSLIGVGFYDFDITGTHLFCITFFNFLFQVGWLPNEFERK